MKSPEKYAQEYFITSIEQDDKEVLINIIRQVQTEAWNGAIEKAAENAAAYDTVPRHYSGNCTVNKESILKLKI
jgi:hypothetical protein